MAPTHKHLHYTYSFLSFSHFETQQHPTHQTPSTSPASSDHALPVLAIAALSIVGTALLLVGYYIIINKCCSNWPGLNLLRWVNLWRARRAEEAFIALSPTMWTRGLDESVIREIPTFQYRTGETEEGIVYGCVVCLNEFQERDMLRVLPNCSHAFHLDCVDIWFQSNSNCPLCRTSISGTSKYPVDRIIAPSSSPQGSQPYTNSLMGSDEDYVVIELGGDDGREREVSGEIQVQSRNVQSPLKVEKSKPGNSKGKKGHPVSIMGDECINVRVKDDQFSIQPIRRSFSLNSAVDRQVYLSVQAIIQQNSHQSEFASANDQESSTNRSVRRSFFPFGHGRGSRNAILPVEFEP